MSIFEVIILAILQGATEFLPVSSSGHLALGRFLLGYQLMDITLDVFLHFGSLIAILFFFRKDIIEIINYKGSNFSLPYLVYIVIGIIPAGLAGVLYKSNIESLFNSINAVGIAYLISAAFLLATLYFKKRDKNLDYIKVAIIGLFQILALSPGVSRSGITISIALLLGISPLTAGKYSFIMVIPLIAGATFKEMIGMNLCASNIMFLIIGILISALVSYLSLKLLFIILKKNRFGLFGIYCLLLSFIIFIFF